MRMYLLLLTCHTKHDKSAQVLPKYISRNQDSCLKRGVFFFGWYYICLCNVKAMTNPTKREIVVFWVINFFTKGPPKQHGQRGRQRKLLILKRMVVDSVPV